MSETAAIIKSMTDEQTNTTNEKFLIFSVLGRLYSLPSRFIGEIALFETVYPLPLMPPYVLGVINRYSIPYALFDISLLLFKSPGERGKVLVIKDDFDRVAFLVDDVADIADIPQDSLIDTERNGETNDLAEVVSASFKWDGNDIFVLDIRRILAIISSETAA